MVAPASQYDKAIDKAREIAAEVAEFAQSINEELRRHQESAVDFHWEHYQIMNFEVRARKLLDKFNTLLNGSLMNRINRSRNNLTENEINALKAIKGRTEQLLYTKMTTIFGRTVNEESCNNALWQAIRWNRSNVSGDAFRNNEEATRRENIARLQNGEEPFSRVINHEGEIGVVAHRLIARRLFRL